MEQYVKDFKVWRDTDGKIILASGQYVPWTMPGKWLKNQVNEYYKQNPGHVPKDNVVVPTENWVLQMMYQILTQPTMEPEPVGQSTLQYQSADDDRIRELEMEIY